MIWFTSSTANDRGQLPRTVFRVVRLRARNAFAGPQELRCVRCGQAGHVSASCKQRWISNRSENPVPSPSQDALARQATAERQRHAAQQFTDYMAAAGGAA